MTKKGIMRKFRKALTKAGKPILHRGEFVVQVSGKVYTDPAKLPKDLYRRKVIVY